MMRGRRAVALLLAAIALLVATACSRTPPPPLPQAVYVWQRRWDAPLVDAVGKARGFANSLRVLALQIDGDRFVEAQVDWDAVHASGLPVTVVVRINGTRDPSAEWLVGLLETQARAWAQRGGGYVDLEVDYDCGVARLERYAGLLRQIRGAIPAIRTLSITALPAWRDASALDGVLAAADLSVLQVHAVSRPDEGLFDGARARRWVADWARRSGRKPFLVALPAYGAQLKLDADGTVAAVESEQRLSRRSAATRELRVDPREIAAWIAQVRARRYPNLAGFAWFRLPREGDERSWALDTLRAVANGQALESRLRVHTAVAPNGAVDIAVQSEGTLDAPLPTRLVVEGDCTAGDGANGYRAVRGAGWRFERDDAALLRAGSGRYVGWLRCADPARISVRAD